MIKVAVVTFSQRSKIRMVLNFDILVENQFETARVRITGH